MKTIVMYESVRKEAFRTRREALADDLLCLLEEAGIRNFDGGRVFANGVIDLWQSILKLLVEMPAVALLEPESGDTEYTIRRLVEEVCEKLQGALPKEEEDDEGVPVLSTEQSITVYDG